MAIDTEMRLVVDDMFNNYHTTIAVRASSGPDCASGNGSDWYIGGDIRVLGIGASVITSKSLRLNR